MIGSMNPVILLIILFLLIAGFWEIVLCEGTHLGSRVVVWLYNISANRYDRIKNMTQPGNAVCWEMPSPMR